MRLLAARCLSGIDEQTEIVIPTLVNCLSDPDSQVRETVLRYLGFFHGRARRALPEVLASMGDQNLTVRNSAMWAACEIEEDVVAMLVERLGMDKPEIREAAALGLQHRGKGDSRAVTALTSALLDKDSNVRKQVAQALKANDPALAEKLGVK
ncbi:MAG: hypothetical protein DME26_03160 [Verrucomicrobia bacterium]|nr:MAG: hypothetical protein DME26_03160 [Verrucomicrobiota bacterium]